MQDFLRLVSRETILFMTFLPGSYRKTPGHHFSDYVLVDLSSSTRFDVLSVSLSHIALENVECI